MVFYNFEFFCNFYRNFLNWVKYERNSGLNFFFLFLSLSHPVLAKNNAGMRFFNFLNFLAIFFRNFLPWAEYERNSGLKLFSLFLDLYHPVLAVNNAGISSFHFLNFFAIFFGIFFHGPSMNGIRH